MSETTLSSVDLADPHQGFGRAARVAERTVRAVARATRRTPGLVASYAVVATVALAAIRPQLFTALDPLRGRGAARLLPPSAEHFFGTDQLGRDLFARVVFGASESVKAVFIAVLIGFLVGSVVGLVSGYVGRWVDDVLMRIVDVLLSVPTLLIALAVISALGFGTVNIALAVGIGFVSSFARVMRAEVLRVRGTAYIESAVFAGAGRFRILWRHVLPNAVGPVLVLAALDLGMAILSVSALSFLGFGAPPPAPEWGLLVAGGRDYMASAWWLTTLPGLVILVTVLAANRIARAFDGSRHVTI